MRIKFLRGEGGAQAQILGKISLRNRPQGGLYLIFLGNDDRRKVRNQDKNSFDTLLSIIAPPGTHVRKSGSGLEKENCTPPSPQKCALPKQ